MAEDKIITDNSDSNFRPSRRKQRLGRAIAFFSLMIVVGLLRASTNLTHPIVDVLQAGLLVLSVIHLIAGLLTKRDPEKPMSSIAIVRDLMIRAGRYDHRGDWDDAIALYQKIQEMGDEQQTKNAENQIKRIKEKKAAAGV